MDFSTPEHMGQIVSVYQQTRKWYENYEQMEKSLTIILGLAGGGNLLSVSTSKLSF